MGSLGYGKSIDAMSISINSHNSNIPQVKGAKARTRVCTPPKNGGASCESLGPAVDECVSQQCAGEYHLVFVRVDVE